MVLKRRLVRLRIPQVLDADNNARYYRNYTSRTLISPVWRGARTSITCVRLEYRFRQNLNITLTILGYRP